MVESTKTEKKLKINYSFSVHKNKTYALQNAKPPQK